MGLQGLCKPWGGGSTEEAAEGTGLVAAAEPVFEEEEQGGS